MRHVKTCKEAREFTYRMSLSYVQQGRPKKQDQDEVVLNHLIKSKKHNDKVIKRLDEAYD